MLRNSLSTVGIGFLAIILGMLALFYFAGVSQQTVVAPKTEGYSLADMQKEYETVLATNPNDEKALYSLARVYYISGQYVRAFDTIATYESLYPENDRIHYVAGLANAYAGNLDEAEGEFIRFIDSGLATWPGYLDLAWVYFQQGNFAEAEETLATAVSLFGENAWLNTSRGAVALAQGDNEGAQEYLLKAQQQAEGLTIDEWKENYSFNDPNNFGEEIAQMQTVIATNLAYARGETPTKLVEAIGAPFASASPLGIERGLAVSACGDSCTTSSCISAANVCGQVNTGTQNSCTGVCSVTVPPNPSGSCSVATECGVSATGYVGCNGACNITRYPFCTTVENPNGDGEIEWVTIGNGDGSGSGPGVTDITCEIFASPTLVRSNDSTVIRWLSTETVSGEVTSSSNDDNWSGTIGEELTSGITEETTYTLTCEGFNGTILTDDTTVDLVPLWQEF